MSCSPGVTGVVDTVAKGRPTSNRMNSVRSDRHDRLHTLAHPAAPWHLAAGGWAPIGCMTSRSQRRIDLIVMYAHRDRDERCR